MKQRTGYRGLLSLIWFLIKANRGAKKYNSQVEFVIRMPFSWFK